MPIYEYLCSQCHKGFERKEAFDAATVTACPVCSGKAKRQFHAVAVIYKGSGFYTTDYKRSSSNSTSNASRDTETEKPDKKETKEEVPESTAKKD